MLVSNRCRLHRWLLAIACTLASAASLAAEPYASIIIDDLGDNLDRSTEVARLPAPISIAIMPNTPYAVTTAKLAHRHGKEVLLHMPMQSVRHHQLTPDALSLHMTRNQFVDKLKHSLSSIPHLVGINNHMGSLITRHPGHMRWLMSTLTEYESLIFVDSRTTRKSVAQMIAHEHDVPNVRRDVFLDPQFDTATIDAQFDRLIRLSKQNGSALAIAHPHPTTLKLIKSRLASLKQNGIKLVPISEYVSRRSRQHVTCTGTTCAGL